MKDKIFKVLSLLIVSFNFQISICQTSVNQVNMSQQKIMVIPYTKEGEDIRTILEEDVIRRIAITKIKESL